MGASLAVTPKARAAAAGKVGSAALTEQMALMEVRPSR